MHHERAHRSDPPPTLTLRSSRPTLVQQHLHFYFERIAPLRVPIGELEVLDDGLSMKPIDVYGAALRPEVGKLSQPVSQSVGRSVR